MVTPILSILAVIRRRRPLIAGVADATLFRRLATVGAALVLALLSCGREPTAPQTRDIAPRFARGFSFSTVFPQLAGSSAFADLVDFNRVHILLHRVDGSVALDTMVTFPPGAESLTLSFDIRLAPGTPATGEWLSLDLAYLNAAGAIVFTGGPVSILAVASLPGAPPRAPITVPVVYTGPGSSARTVRISPRTLSVNSSAPFAFSAVGLDAAGAPVTEAPVVYTVLDPTRATLASSTGGAGTAIGVRGTARIVAQLISGVADTATLTINPVASAIAAVTGNGQMGLVGKPTPRTLAQPLVVHITAIDGLGVAGVPVTFAAANGGSVSPATVTTDADGNAQTLWALGLTALSQTATAAAAGLTGSPVVFSATGQLLPVTRLSLTSGPVEGSSIPSGAPLRVVVSAVDTDGDPVSNFTGAVNVALSANPSGGTLAGTSSVNAVAGVASFAAINIIKPGTGYAIQATSGSLPPVSTPSFNIVPGPPAYIVLLSGGNQAGAVGSALAPVTVLVTDVNGNAKSGVPVTFRIASGGGFVTPAVGVTDASGHVKITWTLGSGVGAQTLSISAEGGPSPITVSATGRSNVAASNTLSGSVYDAVSQVPLSGASIVLSQGDVTVVSTTTASNGTWITAPVANGSYVISVSLQGYVTTSIVTQQVNGTTAAPTVPLVPSSTQPGGISGTMIDATTGRAVSPPVTVELRSGINALTGPALQTVTTNSSAQYLFSAVAPGTYTVLSRATGYINASKTAVSVGGSTVTGQTVVISPTAGVGSVRIVLTWRQSPNDLDSHLTGPSGPDTTRRFHVYYGGRGSCTAAPFACLDQDVTSGNGPETMTISQVIPGRYRYGVQNYSCCGNGGNATDASLSRSGGKVEVYISNVLAQTFAVPTTPGSFWTVFELNGNAITPINQIESNGPFVSLSRSPTANDPSPAAESDLDRVMNDIRTHPKRAGIPRQ